MYTNIVYTALQVFAIHTMHILTVSISINKYT